MKIYINICQALLQDLLKIVNISDIHDTVDLSHAPNNGNSAKAYSCGRGIKIKQQLGILKVKSLNNVPFSFKQKQSIKLFLPKKGEIQIQKKRENINLKIYSTTETE